MDTKLVPIKCNECKAWAVFEINLINNGANFKCTHCGNEFPIEGTQKQTKETISNLRKYAKIEAQLYPEILNLKNPGDHTILSEKD